MRVTDRSGGSGHARLSRVLSALRGVARIVVSTERAQGSWAVVTLNVHPHDG
ncbi:MAG: hypothetical protein H0W24_00805 [Lysobacter sp.]|nr:hypothetical protein [Lysobacter sp.]MDQ3205612.1 hypothetical protein [Pseudomonadota bacterium]